MSGSNRTRRQAFSLLEMVLALAMGMTLLLALYLTLNTHVRQVHAGREILDEGTLARSILTRIASDIISQLGRPSIRAFSPTTSSSSSGEAAAVRRAPAAAAVRRVPALAAVKLIEQQRFVGSTAVRRVPAAAVRQTPAAAAHRAPAAAERQRTKIGTRSTVQCRQCRRRHQ